MRNGPLTERKSLEIITGIAQALIIAEENHIVHRDIKPDNIMLDGRGTPKLADLGLAKHDIDSRTSLTLGGSFMGTPAYMSPEQARDAKVADTRDDIYSLGATFYECLTGQPPFSGETPYNIMSELLTKPSPKPRAQRPELSPLRRSCLPENDGQDARPSIPRRAHARGRPAPLQRGERCGNRWTRRRHLRKGFPLRRGRRRSSWVCSLQATVRGLLCKKPPSRTRRSADAPRPPDYSALRAAVLLVVLVTAATLLFAWMSPQHLWTNVKEQVSVLQSDFVAPTEHPHKKPIAALVSPPRVQPAETESTPHSAPTEVAPLDAAPVPTALPAGTNLFSTSPTPPVASGPANATLPLVPGTIPALPVNTNVVAQPAVSNGIAVPAAPATSDSALAARDVAEKSLPNRLLGTNGHAQLLHIHGKHSDDQPTPTLWIFDFFDPKAAGHSLIRTVANHQVVDNGQRLTDIISPYTPANILPDDIIDSSQALQIAAQLVPTIPVSGSEFELKQDKNSAAFWTVTLWAKNSQGEGCGTWRGGDSCRKGRRHLQPPQARSAE